MEQKPEEREEMHDLIGQIGPLSIKTNSGAEAVKENTSSLHPSLSSTGVNCTAKPWGGL